MIKVDFSHRMSRRFWRTRAGTDRTFTIGRRRRSRSRTARRRRRARRGTVRSTTPSNSSRPWSRAPAVASFAPSLPPFSSPSYLSLLSWPFSRYFFSLCLEWKMDRGDFQVKDRHFQQYVHAVPGAEHVRHQIYEPSRGFILEQYSRVTSGRH